MKINIDLHVHTNHSMCAILKPTEIEDLALKRGLDAIAITDHNTIDGALEVKKYSKKIKIIIGEEIKTNQGEVLGYFLKERIPPFFSPEETIKEIRNQGGLVSIPHPFDLLRSSRIDSAILEKVLPELDMIEVFNSRDILLGQNSELIEKAFQIGIIPVVGSDAHLSIEMGKSYITMQDFDGPENFLKNLKGMIPVKRKSPFWVHLVTKALKLKKKGKH